MLKIGDFSRLSQLFGELFRDFPGSAARGPCFAIWHDDSYVTEIQVPIAKV